MIYFISDLSGVGPVKIGYTSGSVEERRKALQTGSPMQLAIVAMAEGSEFAEKRLHDICEPERLHGEWFKRGPRTLNLLRDAQSGTLIGLDDPHFRPFYEPDDTPSPARDWLIVRSPETVL
jgi:hypothetical protein